MVSERGRLSEGSGRDLGPRPRKVGGLREEVQCLSYNHWEPQMDVNGGG